ncbi:hypothetical protein EDC01DRAFT_783263 [Geopyxis carbonaria]|nr:hypothetical protein EDC01DRAFT_783263 [Geopyxis carbonaria]
MAMLPPRTTATPTFYPGTFATLPSPVPSRPTSPLIPSAAHPPSLYDPLDPAQSATAITFYSRALSAQLQHQYEVSTGNAAAGLLAAGRTEAALLQFTQALERHRIKYARPDGRARAAARVQRNVFEQGIAAAWERERGEEFTRFRRALKRDVVKKGAVEDCAVEDDWVEGEALEGGDAAGDLVEGQEEKDEKDELGVVVTELEEEGEEDWVRVPRNSFCFETGEEVHV